MGLTGPEICGKIPPRYATTMQNEPKAKNPSRRFGDKPEVFAGAPVAGNQRESKSRRSATG